MSPHQDLWSARLPNGEVRSGTLEQLDEARRAGHLSETTLVRSSHSDQWIKLADVLGGAGGEAVRAPAIAAPVPRASVPVPAATAQPVSPRIHGEGELWQVRLPSGEVRSGTRQQLVEAFRAGQLDAELLALSSGAREWVRLGTVIERSEPSLQGAPSVSPPRVVSASPPPPVDRPLASSPAPAPAPVRASGGSEEPWLLRLADGQVRTGTREQLEEAVRAGNLDESALVLAPGASEWATLGSLARGGLSAPGWASVATVPTPMESQPAAPDVTPQQAPASALEQTPTAPAHDTSSSAENPVEGEHGQPGSQAAEDGEPLWQVKLTGKQLQDAFHAGLLGDDTQVLAAGGDQWVPLGEVRRAQSAPGEVRHDLPSTPDAPATNGVAAESDGASAG